MLVPGSDGSEQDGDHQAGDSLGERLLRGGRAGAGHHVRPAGGGGHQQDGLPQQEVRGPAHRRRHRQAARAHRHVACHGPHTDRQTAGAQGDIITLLIYPNLT